MVARVASFEGINVEAARRTMAEADAIIRPLVEGLAGYQGHLDLATRDGKFALGHVLRLGGERAGR